MKRILVIDDAATVRMYHKSILQSEGYEVEEAINGIEAIEKALNGHFDIYIVDINMPKLDGYGFLKELRTLEIPQAPAIMVSTESDDTDKKKAFICGANYYLVKPVKPEQLATIVKLLIRGE